MSVEVLASPKSAAQRIFVEVPTPFESQLVFRAEFRDPFEVAAPTGLRFQLCRGPMSYLGMANRLQRLVGQLGTWKALLKLVTPRRVFYVVSDEVQILHHGWLTVGHCRHYHVGPRDVVVGPIWTSAAARGRGVATFATRMAINEMIRDGHYVFYIDTACTNAPCLRVIDKCRFGPPLATYVRIESVRT